MQYDNTNTSVDHLVSGYYMRMTSYNSSDFCEMVIIYGECQWNASQAAREYAIIFPSARHLSANAITQGSATVQGDRKHT